ncbi:NAD(P)/FAD-dependent oxidoreductase [Chlorogloeopsis sp. ULAP01]|uniref:NAD(P)/FAD-dependent oxidoreductase n=1 Tax=Chlorogloeopsis sp. ULAP01 TaxID=3056483 RepID=UPI0025AAD40A|nr:NAD(P)/FAD-dependent oxidoreductase [Chlorogloeopsis sp. ULAP01]MDM9384650.1 NAD(P)/FAD-dependent oxidoreductase [Chlorogloeopsis sp. ULAP01]
MKLTKRTLAEHTDHIYDAIVVGGGAGGLSAGIYLQRYLLSSLIIDKGKARSFWMQELHNYVGLPADTPGRTLLKQGREHYLSLGGDLLDGYVEEVVDEGETFAVHVKVGRQDSVYQTFRSKYLIVASGIIDYLAEMENTQNVYDYAGYNLHVCLICDGYEMTNKKVGVFANSNSNAEVVFPLGWFTPYITLFTQGKFEVEFQLRQKLQKYGYQLVETPIKQFLGKNHQMSGVELEDGTVIELEAGLISMGSKYHADYLQGFNLEKQGGNLVTDKMACTSHPRIFAIGDLKVGLNQVVIAAADGALAATQIWRDIRRRHCQVNEGSSR